MLMSILGTWRAYRQWGHASAEAKQLVGEAKRILKKKRYRIPESVAATMTAAVGAVESARSTLEWADRFLAVHRSPG